MAFLSTSPPSMALSPQEMQAAQSVISLLRSDKYKNSMYLFLTPFDIDQVPGYLDVVTKKLDLQTVEDNLHAGGYVSLAEFWDDLTGIFDNAVIYHSLPAQSATTWIAKLAKDMLKVVHRERNKRERQSSIASMSSLGSVGTTNTNKKIKIRVGGKNTNKGGKNVGNDGAGAEETAQFMPPPANVSSLEAGVEEPASAVPPPSEPSPVSKTKVKIKLKLGGGGGGGGGGALPQHSTSTSTAASPTSGLPVASAAGTGTPPTPSAQQPKLKLKLSLGGGQGGGGGAAKLPASSAADGSVDPEGDVMVPAKPRKSGKQVPAGVAEGSAGSTSAAEAVDTATAKPKAKKPKLTLKLGGAAAGGSGGGATAVADGGGGGGTPRSAVVVGGGPSRGKELPKGVVAAAAANTNKKKSPKAGTAATAAAETAAAGPGGTSIGAPTASAASATGGPTTAAAGGKANKKPKKAKNLGFPTAAATKVVLGLKRRQSKSIAWFLQPVSDKAILADYRAKIRHPIDLQTISAKLDRGSYGSVAAFVTDLRRISSNCLQYNTSIRDSLRPVAVEVLETAEQLVGHFLKNLTIPQAAAAAAGAAASTGGPASLSYPSLLYCWKLCIGVLDTLYNLVNPEDGQPTAFYFLHPVSYYCGGNFPVDYLEKVPKPMDFGTVTANLLEGRYQTCDAFCNDCRLVISNCTEYYRGREDGKPYMEQASRLNEVLSQQIEQLGRYVRSSRGLADQARAAAPAVLLQPPVPVLLSTLEELRALKYTDKATKITEPAMGPFERPVSLAAYPDYLQYVETPMDLQSIERKVKSHAYLTPEDFEYDVNLVFRNCELYNARRNGDHLVAMAKFGARQFRRLFHASIRAFEDPLSVVSSPTTPDAAASGSMAGGGASKKLKLDFTGASAAAGAALMKPKTAPRISITAAQLSSAALNAARAKSPGGAGQKKNLLISTAPSLSLPKADQPIPLHIAIARVKEAFPIRRPHKQLQPWEADCARYFKELMRHPWISAARPKFIFHVPVPILFPELREPYSAKIRKPMDLTTVECTLLQGNRYTQPDDFLQDVALVFANAVRFNRDGRDVGDPLSCAYYDASVHLLRYSRWLSLEILLPYSDSSSPHADEDTSDGLPPFSWRLTEGNRQRARVEMEKLVMSEPIDKSLEGDRYSWHEAECEKLLKALRHQSDLKYMTFFIQANYPPDYTAFIAKPMDWEKVQRTLKKRQYDKFGDVVNDLRLIFANALRYNSRLKGTDTVSGRAFDAATYMSAKLESAIAKFLLSASDRLERERIDHTNAEREIESLEQAEEARIRELWKNPKEGEKEALGAAAASSSSSAGGANVQSDAATAATMASGAGAGGAGAAVGDLASASAAGGGGTGAAGAGAAAAAFAFPKVRLRAQRRETVTDFEIPFFDEGADDTTSGTGGGRHERSYVEHVKFQKSLFERQRRDLAAMRRCSSSVARLVVARHVRSRLATEWLRRETRAAVAAAGTDAPAAAAAASPNEEAKAKENASAVLGLLDRPNRAPVKLLLSSKKNALANPRGDISGRSSKRRKVGSGVPAPPVPSLSSLLSSFAGDDDDDDE